MKKREFSEKDEKGLKVLSKIIYIVAKIMKVCSLIVFVCAILGFVACLIVLPKISINKDDNTIKVFNYERKYTLTDEKLIIDEDNNVVIKFENNEKKYVDDFINMSMVKRVVIPSFGLFIVVVSMFFAYKLFGYMGIFFLNIYNSKVPFISDNIKVLENVIVNLVSYLLIPDAMSSIFELLTDYSYTSVDFLDDIFLVLIVVVGWILYKNGCDLQNASSDKKVVKKEK